MSELFQQLGNLLGKEIFTPDYPVKISQIVILFATLVVSCVIANFLHRRFREFFKDRLLALLFPVVMIIGMLLGLRLAGIGTGIFSKFLHYPLTDLLLQSPEIETEISETNRLTLAGLFYGFVVISGMLILSKYVQSLLDKQVNIKENTRSILKRLLSYVFITVGILISLSIIGISLTNLAIAIGGVGIGIGIGLQNVASNLISRLIIFFEKPIKDGDIVEIRDQSLFGRVASIDFCSTVIVSLDEKTIIIPNSQLTTESINNLTYENNLFQLRIAVGVSYNSDVEVVKKALIEAAHEHSEVIKEPCPEVENVTPPLVRLIKFGGSSLDFELLVWIPDPFQRFDIASDLHLKVWEKFQVNNIRIAYRERNADFYPREKE